MRLRDSERAGRASWWIEPLRPIRKHKAHDGGPAGNQQDGGGRRHGIDQDTDQRPQEMPSAAMKKSRRSD
jgi:hypothetical protein